MHMQRCTDEHTSVTHQIKYPENLSSQSTGIPCRHIGGQKNMMKLIVTFWNFVNVPKKLLIVTIISDFTSLMN